MTLKRFLVGPFEAGKQNNIEPWLLPEDAFQQLLDAYVWRGRVKKRFGYSLIGASDLQSRLKINLGNTDGSGNISGTVPGSIFKIGQMFSIGTEIFTVNATGTPAAMLDTGAATTATFNTTTGAFVINGADATTTCWFYPAEPVMGLITREATSINFEDIVAFDTQFSYVRSGGAWTRLDAATSWAGSDSQFFWGSNYRGANPYDINLYVVNFNSADNIKYLPQGSSAWTNLRPQLDSGATRFLDSARIIMGYKDRLIALNTIETDGGSQTFPYRCRFSQNGDPTTAATSWLDDTPGRGGYIDAPTTQHIVTAQIIKGRLIVYFERSTWELAYTGFPDAPFRWQQINNELGCESTFSVIGFDDAIFGVGNVGVHSCNGVNVTRIDEKIPDEVYKIHNGNAGPERVYGIRDYVPELVYWAFPSDLNNPTYPNRVLVYNYRNATWAFFRDSFTCFGYFQKDSDLTWALAGDVYFNWNAWNDPWNSGREQSAFPDIIAGNQQGFTVILNTDDSTNAQSLYITDSSGADTLVVIDHNLEAGDYILVEGAQGLTSINNTIVKVESVTDANTIVVDTPFGGTYTGGGKLTRVSQLDILTKQWNPGTPLGFQFTMPYIDFLLDTTENGEIDITYLVDASTGTTVQDNTPTGVLLGSTVLKSSPEELFPEQANSIYNWHRYFVQALGQFIQLRLTLNDEQMKDIDISSEGFTLNAMLLYVGLDGREVG